MGIDTRGKLMVGLQYQDIITKGLFDEETLDGLIENEALEYASPHYDSDNEDWFVGIEISGGEYGATIGQIATAREQFMALVHLEPEVRGLAHVS